MNWKISFPVNSLFSCTEYKMHFRKFNFLLLLLGSMIMSFRSDHFEFRKVVNNTFTAGENIEFKVHYGFVTAGYGSAKILPYIEKYKGRDVYHVIGRGRSASGFDWFFKVRDEFHSYIDVQSLAPLKFNKDQQEGSYANKDEALFDHANKSINNTKGKLTMPEYTQDVLSMMYYARCLNFKESPVGTTFSMSFYLDNEINTIQFRIEARENINTEIGTYRAIKIHPQVIADRVFKDKDAVTLWVSDDANLLPLRIQADLVVGSIKADITKVSNLKNPADALIK